MAYCLERYDINLQGAMDALKDLERMNINYLTLFPDLQGAALDANMVTHWFHYSDLMKEITKT